MSAALALITGGWLVLIGILWWLFRRPRRPRCLECRAQMERAVVDHGLEGAETVWSCPNGHTEIAAPDELD